MIKGRAAVLSPINPKKVVSEVVPGDTFGETAFLEGRRYPNTVKAVISCEVSMLTRQDLQVFIVILSPSS